MPNHPFGLLENPFADGYDPQFIYRSAKRAEAMTLLRKRIADGESFVTITGESGCGKTSVVTELLDDEALRANVAFIAHPSLTPSELLEAVCIEFGAPLPNPPSKPQTLASLERHLRALRQEGQTPVLVLDEAHGLKTELLEETRLLSNMKADGRALLQTILVGVPELERRLGLPELAQLRQRISVHCRIPPLTAEETEGYLQHRVSAAGGDGPAIFPADACREVHNYTNGLPRDLNTLAGRALECADQDGAGAVAVEHVRVAAGDARPPGIATAPRASSGPQPFELRRTASLARSSSPPPRAPERRVEREPPPPPPRAPERMVEREPPPPPPRAPERMVDREPPPPPPKPPKPEVRQPPSFLRVQQAARSADAILPIPAAVKTGSPPLERRFRSGDLTAAEMAVERTAPSEGSPRRGGFFGSESVRELGASVLLVGLLVIVLMATGRWDPILPLPGPPVAENPGLSMPPEVQRPTPEPPATRAADAMVEPPAPAPPPPAPAPVDPGPLPATSASDLTLGGGSGPQRGIGFEVASSIHPDSASSVLRRITRGSKLPCRIVTKTSGDTYRVVVGPFTSRREAEKAITELFRHALVERARIVQLVD
jgi:MSHA biogenesis protein MshM